jgi:hypothetical protein
MNASKLQRPGEVSLCKSLIDPDRYSARGFTSAISQLNRDRFPVASYKRTRHDSLNEKTRAFCVRRNILAPKMLFGPYGKHNHYQDQKGEKRPPKAPPILLKAVYQDQPNTESNANPSDQIVSGHKKEGGDLVASDLVLAFLLGAASMAILALIGFLWHQRNCNTKTLDSK